MPLRCYIFCVLCILCFHLALADDTVQYRPRPKIGLVLSGGGAKGIAHVGALKVIEEAGISVDYVAGTSMGAIIGGLYALGYTATQLENYVAEANWDVLLIDRVSRSLVSVYEKDDRTRYWLQFPIKKGKIGLPRGLLSGQNVLNFFTQLASPAYNQPDFNMFPRPFHCIATDIDTGDGVVLQNGDLAKAMRASMAIPSVFTPVEINKRYLYDGGLINNFPADEALKMGADILIGVDVSEQPSEHRDPNTMFKALEQAVFMASLPLKEANKKLCHILIIPDIKEYGATSFDRADSLIMRGQRAAQSQFYQLKALADSLHQFEKIPIDTGHDICPQPLHSLYVQDITIKGLHNLSKEYVLQKLDISTPSEVTFEKINKGIEQLQGSQFFESVVYQIVPASDYAVVLEFDVLERNTNLFRVGFCYDNDFKAALMMNLTFRNAVLNNSKASLDLLIGENPEFMLSYFQSPSLKPLGKTLFKSRISPDWIFKVHGYQQKAYGYDENKLVAGYSFGSLTMGMHMMIPTTLNSLIAGGVVVDYFSIQNDIGGLETLASNNYLFLNYRLNFQCDTYNNDYFPTKGYQISVEGIYAKGVSKNVRSFDAILGATFRSGFTYTPADRYTISSGINVGSVLGNDIPPQYMYYVGGMGYKELRGNIRFVGLHYMQKSAKNIWTLSLDNQMRLWNNIYLIWRMNLGKAESEYKDFFPLRNLFFGYGVSAQYSSVIGPIGFTLSSSNITRQILGNINIGFWF